MGLQGVRVLVTRPAGQADAFQEVLAEAGACPLHYPALAILPLSPDDDSPEARAARACMLDADRFDTAIFVSTNAVEAGLAWMEHFWPQWPQGLRCIAIGAATARALAAHGLFALAPGEAENTEALLTLPELQHMAGRRVMIVRGVGGRAAMAQALRDRGAEVRFCEVYRRALPTGAPPLGEWLARERVQCLTAASGETLENMVTLAADAPGRLLALPVVVPGARVVALARDLGFCRVLEAVNASPGAMLEALRAGITE